MTKTNSNQKKLSNLTKIYTTIKPFFGYFNFVLIFILVIVAIIGFGGLSVVLAKYNNLGSIKEKVVTPAEGSVVYDRNGAEMFRYFDAGEKRELIELEKIPEVMQLAVIAMEDENFYYNSDGIPWTNMVGAVYRCFITREGCRGGSGLSQQLIKKITDRESRALTTTELVGVKVDELIASYKFNQEVTKDDVLELYLNLVPFGRNTYGVQEASRSYFGHDIDAKGENDNYKLTPEKACFLGSMLTKPESFAFAIKQKIENDTENNNWKTLVGRKNSCLDKLATKEIRGAGTGFFLRSSDVEDLKNTEVDFKKFVGEPIKFGHIKNYLTRELTTKFDLTESDLSTKGLAIKTTFDIETQKEVERIIQEGVDTYVKPAGGNNAAAIVLDGPSGQILAMVGSADFNNSDIDGQVNVVTSPRQPGSSIKPYVYASAFQNGFNPSTVLLDVPIDFGGGYKPLNFDRNFYGPVSMRWALQNSLNIPAVKSLFLSQSPSNSPDGQNALNNFFAFAEATGLEFPYRDRGICGIATSVGGCEVTMLSHATGINTMLHEGNLKTSSPFLEIKLTETNFADNTETTRDLYAEAMEDPENSPYPQKEAVIEPTIARQITNVMADYQSRAPEIWGSTSQSLLLEGWTGVGDIAAKTGTTNDVKDVWTVGGNTERTVLIWGGNTDSSPMNQDLSSARVVAPIWKDIMTYVSRDLEKTKFSTAGLSQYNVNPSTGLKGSGVNELMTNKQTQRLDQVDARIQSGNINLQDSIFENMTSVFGSVVRVNKADNLLVPEGESFPDDLADNLECRLPISAFPLADNWIAGVASLLVDPQSGYPICPTEESQLNQQDLSPSVTLNIASNSQAPRNIVVDVSTVFEDQEIINIELQIDGRFATAINDKNKLNYPTGSVSGTRDVDVIIRDNFGIETRVNIQNVEFSRRGNVITPDISNSDSNSNRSSRGGSNEIIISTDSLIQNTNID